MHRLLLLILLTGSWSAVAQDADLARGDSLRLAGDLRGAADAFARAFEIEENSDVAYRLASTYALSQEHLDDAFRYLGIALETDESVGALHDPDLYFLTLDDRWTAVKNRQLDRLGETLGEGFDRSYAEALLEARMREWAYRYHIMLAFRELGPESPILGALANSMQERHAQNEEALAQLLDEKGWPALSVVGEAAAYAAGNVINHASLEVRQRYLPLLEQACEAGEADWSRYAHILDRTELELGRSQIYGTQMEQNPTTGLYEPRPLMEPGLVDERRAAKGMEPLAAQLKRFNDAMKRDFGG